MDPHEPVHVYTVSDAVRAEFLANVLREEGITCFLGGINQASVAAIPGTSIQVYVRAEDAERATRIIEELERTEAKAEG